MTSMTTMATKTTYLKDYTPYPYSIAKTDLAFQLEDDHTIVTSTLTLDKNKVLQKQTDAKNQDKTPPPIVLNGDSLTLNDIHLNNEPLLNNTDYTLTPESLTITKIPKTYPFTLTIKTTIHPEKNTALSGLYRSKTMFCTQCEAEGFRRITFYPDRPDVMAKFTTTIIADKKKYPVLLSNGNCIESGSVKDLETHHFVRWEDPFKKPSYLFALVAGDLIALEDHYVTKSNRLVKIKLFVEKENQDKCAHAIQAVKKAFKWDEDTYGREYDLDIYMIVAVNDFNMGAMENKGLNIFNASYILARPETATDGDYEHIDAVVGHEYFHNWTGNRITCRDWFQLSLKEGLTVFREHQFMRDITKSPVSLIENARYLRTHQFAEDSGPMSHPVRPDSYVEINNFYTATIYEKGAEVIRMIQTLIGEENFRKGMDIYFDTYDGQAVAIEEFVASMEKASNTDLTHFKLWYTQAGTPEITVSSHFDETAHAFTLTLKQFTPKTQGQPNKLPLQIPIAIGLLDSDGKDLLPNKTEVLSLLEEQQTFSFALPKTVTKPPVLSLLRGFSAPVKVQNALTEDELAFLLAKDTDAFTKWDAGQQLTTQLLFQLAKQYAENGLSYESVKHTSVEHQSEEHKSLEQTLQNSQWLTSHLAVLANNDINPALKAEILTFPSLTYLVEQKIPADIDALYHAKKLLIKYFVKHALHLLISQYEKFYTLTLGPYQFSPEDVANRTLKNLSLYYLMQLEGADLEACVKSQWEKSNNMTDTLAALGAIIDTDLPFRSLWLQDFYEKWQHNPLVMNKWLRIQAMSDRPNTLAEVKSLMKHPAFSMTNPNNVYALIGGFCSGNLYRFHDKSGEGYTFLGDVIKTLNSINPQVAARMIKPLTQYKRFDENRQRMMKKILEELHALPNLSRDLEEIIAKSLL